MFRKPLEINSDKLADKPYQFNAKNKRSRHNTNAHRRLPTEAPTKAT